MTTAVASRWQNRRRQVFQSVFQTDTSQPTPQSTPCITAPDPGQAFGGPPAPTTTTTTAAANTATPSAGPLFSQPATTQHFAPPSDLSSSSQSTIPGLSQSQCALPQPAQPRFPSLATAGDDQVAYDRAWHVVTARIALPSSATADDSFGTLPSDSQLRPPSQQAAGSDSDFYNALRLVVHAPTLLPRATHTDDIVAWHAQQVRTHFAQHVIPLLSGCVDGEDDESGGEASHQSKGTGARRDGGKRKGNHYERHMVMVMSSIRTLEAAFRLYFYGLGLVVRGLGRLADGSCAESPSADAEALAARFRRDIHALVGNSASEGLMRSVRTVLERLTGTILGIPEGENGGTSSKSAPSRPAAPTDKDLRAMAARQRLHEVVEQLHNVGLAGERFQVIFAEIMNSMMSRFVTGAYAGLWNLSSPGHDGFSATANTISRGSGSSFLSPCIVSLSDWVENHFARLSFEILSRVQPDASSSPVTLSDVKTYQALALGRLAALRISELFDIALAWPSSRGAVEDLRATITTTARRLQLTASFSRALQRRLLHPGRSTLEILRTYIAIIRTLHALDPSKVLLSHIEPSLQLYLCQREDAIRVVVTGLLSSAEEIKAARKAKEDAKRQQQGKQRDVGPFATPAMPSRATRTPRTLRTRHNNTPVTPATGDTKMANSAPTNTQPSSKLVELALLLNDPSQTRRTAPEDEGDLDWDDMKWVPDPVDAGANYKRPKSEDVIGTLISALGSEDVFIKEFASVVAGRLLGEPAKLEQELRVLDLLKRRFGEAALQNCDVMIRDVQDSRRLDAAILRARVPETQTPIRTPHAKKGPEAKDEMQYHARILSRLFWPNLDREHFLLPQEITDYQQWYERGYERLKSKRKLAWLNQLGQARVELELEDRTVTVDCSTVEATVIYAFQDASEPGPVRRSVDELYLELQMDEDLIADALAFWAGQGVLKRVSQGLYVVVESTTAGADAGAGTPGGQGGSLASSGVLSPGDGDGDGEAAASARKPAAGGMSAKEQERRVMYWQYIKGMLTNASASMALAQVAMMMKMLVPDGFPWSNEELQDFLGEKVADGELEVVGSKYKLVKK
ncbi:anaphase-promoting complex subunit 2 [Podospora conica]|nr:anaphase-promoting complex subunit 2 [Schizothecium conicum]